MRLLVDEDLASRELIARLTAAFPGEVLLPDRESSDEEVWQRAQYEGAAIITGNVVDLLALDRQRTGTIMTSMLSSFVLRVSRNNGRGLEQLLAPAPGEPDPRLLSGAVVEASYANTDPALLARLQQLRVPYVIDSQSVRFASRGFLTRESLRSLPYAPDSALRTVASTRAHDSMIRGALEFQANHGATHYLVPGLPTLRPSLPSGKLFEHVHRVACDLVGAGDVPALEVIAYVAPSLSVVRSPYLILERLPDLPLVGVAVQPISWSSKSASVEWLTSYVEFLLLAEKYKIPVLAGRAGAFGLVLIGLGVTAFETGLGEGESFDLSALNREPRASSGKSGGGRVKHAYLGPLMTSVDVNVARSLFAARNLRAELSCDTGECQYAGFEGQVDNPRAHFFHTRPREIGELLRLPNGELRLQLLVSRLRRASEMALRVNAFLESEGLAPVPTGHLGRWLAVTGRVGARLSGTRAE